MPLTPVMSYGFPYGALSALPDASAVPANSLYLALDDATIYKSDGVSWAALGSLLAIGDTGGLPVLERHVASNSSSLDFTSFISATYDKYLIVGESLIVQTNGASLYVRFGSGGGPTWDDGSGNTYVWASNGINTVGAGTTDSGQSGSPRLFNQMSNAAGYGTGSFRMMATHLQSTSLRKHLTGDGNYANTTPAQIIKTQGIAWTDTANACTGLQFIASTGNIMSGSITIYGMPNS